MREVGKMDAMCHLSSKAGPYVCHHPKMSTLFEAKTISGEHFHMACHLSLPKEQRRIFGISRKGRVFSNVVEGEQYPLYELGHENAGSRTCHLLGDRDMVYV